MRNVIKTIKRKGTRAGMVTVVVEKDELEYLELKEIKNLRKRGFMVLADSLMRAREFSQLNEEEEFKQKVLARLAEKIQIDKYQKNAVKCKQLVEVNSDSHRILSSLPGLLKKIKQCKH